MEIKFQEFERPRPIKHRESFEKYIEKTFPGDYKFSLKTNGLSWEHTFQYSDGDIQRLFNCWRAAKDE